MNRFALQNGEKFAFVAFTSVHTEFPKDAEFQLLDGTWVLQRIPFILDELWEKWVGQVRFEQLKDANLVLARLQPSRSSGRDSEHDSLAAHLIHIYRFLQFSGVVEYMGASCLKGSFHDGVIVVHELGRLPEFRPTRGSTRTPVTLDRLERAAHIVPVLSAMQSSGDYQRLMRGLGILLDGLQQEFGQERLHQFVRALEALVLPDVANTRRQFVHRCQGFATANPAAPAIMGQAFDMRSDAEHVHEWHRSLQNVAPEKPEDVALQRTRQMERLACFGYSRILENPVVQEHFKNETTIRSFWNSLDDAQRRAICGISLDLNTIPIVREYDGWGRAKAQSA